MDDTAADTGRSLALGKSQTLVRVMDRARAITAGLKDDNERACFKAILGRHPEFLVEGLSAHYPIDADLLEHYADAWDWEALSTTRLWPFFRLAIGMIINALSWTEKISRESSPGFASVPLLPNPILIFRAFMFQSVSQNGC